MNWLEFWGFVTGAVCVWLAVKEHVWNWPIGIVNDVLYLIVFFRTKLYADSSLQIVYIVIGFYGWWNWLFGGVQHSVLHVSRASKLQRICLSFSLVGGTVIIYWLLHRFTDSNVPFWDAITTALSLVAQYMLGKKLLENWLVWITADAMYVGVYIYKSLYLTSALYFIFLVMCVFGWSRWQRASLSQVQQRMAE
jgi:nicotinamide mononucleotide transporter